MLNIDDFCLKDEHVDFLISLDWIRSFGITGKNKNFCTAHLIITTEPDTKPSMETLQERFGDEIKFYVDFVEGKASIMLSFQMNGGVQSPPKSGDAIYIDEEPGYGSLCMFAKYPDSHQLYALTGYHVLYNGDELSGDHLGRFEQLKSDCSDENSETSKTGYCYRSQVNVENAGGRVQRLGMFHKGVFNHEHDLGVVKVYDDVTCDHTITEIEGDNLTEREVLKQIFNGNFPDVLKNGAKTGLTKGELFECGFLYKYNRVVIVKDAFIVKVNEGERAFMEEGDSGSLVVWEDESGNKHPFAYCCATLSYPDALVHEHKYICFSLKDSLTACDPNLVPYYTRT